MDTSPWGELSPAASAVSPGGRGKPCCLKKTHPNPHPGKFPLWAEEAAGLYSTQSSLCLAPPPATALVTGDSSKPTTAAGHSLWQRQIDLFWPNFLPISSFLKGSSTLTEDLQAPSREGSSGCEHFSCHGTGELCQPRQDGGLAASCRGQALQRSQSHRAGGERAFICLRESLKNQEVLKAAAFPSVHNACAVSANCSHKNIIPQLQQGQVKQRWCPGLLAISQCFSQLTARWEPAQLCLLRFLLCTFMLVSAQQEALVK